MQTGMSRLRQASVRLGQTSSSTNPTTSGLTRPRKRSTPQVKSIGMRPTLATSEYNALARASPVSVEAHTTTCALSASIGTSVRSALTSPTDTACSSTRRRVVVSGLGSITTPSRSAHPLRALRARDGEATAAATRYAASTGFNQGPPVSDEAAEIIIGVSGTKKAGIHPAPRPLDVHPP